jgi:hypothetical protein
MSDDLAIEELGPVFEVGGVGTPSSSSPASKVPRAENSAKPGEAKPR